MAFLLLGRVLTTFKKIRQSTLRLLWIMSLETMLLSSTFAKSDPMSASKCTPCVMDCKSTRDGTSCEDRLCSMESAQKRFAGNENKKSGHWLVIDRSDNASDRMEL